MSVSEHLRGVDVELRKAELREEFFPRLEQLTDGSLRVVMIDIPLALSAAAAADVELAQLERRLVVAQERAKRATDRLQQLADKLGNKAQVHVMPGGVRPEA